MKKLKTILSIALICVLALGGGMLLTGCNKDDKQATIENDVIELYSTPWENELYKIEFLGAETSLDDDITIHIGIIIKEDNCSIAISESDFVLYYLNNHKDTPGNKLVDCNYTRVNTNEVTNYTDKGLHLLTLEYSAGNVNFITSKYELTWEGYSLAVFTPHQQVRIA